MMKKALHEMTIEELWELFPIVLTEHQSCWSDWYEEEKNRITGYLTDCAPRINHIGSTAIRDIWAKPIVDILVEIPPNAMEPVKQCLLQHGYLCMSEGEKRKSFNMGYTEDGFAEKVFHLHLRCFGDHNELYFRDYMNDHPILAKEYEKLKLTLWKTYEHDRDAYTEAKTEFVTKYTECAKIAYPNRYERSCQAVP